jgi:aryl-alcohol dehydrogenase-like predicted oxidoreductase
VDKINQVEKRRLGQTEIQVTPVGLGTMEFAGGGGLIGAMFPVIPQANKNEIIKAALDGGINWFDTAEMYGNGVSESSLAEALRANGKSDQDVVVATKWMPLLRTANNIPHTIKNRIKFLSPYKISLYVVHQPWGFSSPEAEMDAMAALCEAGQIQSVGVSNFNPERMRRAQSELKKHKLTLAVNQVRYSLLHREIESDGTLETAKELGITIIAYTPIASGMLSGKYHKNPELLKRQPFYRRGMMQRELETSRPLVNVLEEMAQRYQVTAAQIALNWVINFHGDTIITIPGATKVQQARESAGAMHFKLSADDLAKLDDLSKKTKKE